MRVCIHRGSHQVGGSCVEIEQNGQRLLLDMGLPLDVENEVSHYLPEIRGLDGRDPNLKGVLISHPHADHYGLLALLSEKVPIGIGPAARRILNAAAPFLRDGFEFPDSGWDFSDRQTLTIGEFQVTPYLVDHSAYDAYSLLIEAGGKRVFYSGDFRSHGRKASLYDRLVDHAPEDVDVMLLEGTTLGRKNGDSLPLTEQDLETRLIDIFKKTRGLALVHASAQNIDRIVSIFRASKRSGRRLIIDLYTAAILEATQNERIPQSHWSEVALYVPQRQRRQIKRQRWFTLLKRHSSNRIYMEDIQREPGKYAMLFRPLHQEDVDNTICLSGLVYIYSMWEGYWERPSFQSVASWLENHSVPMYHIHTSGHADPANLKALAEAVSPGEIVPIHSFRPDLYQNLFTNVKLHEDGEWWEI